MSTQKRVPRNRKIADDFVAKYGGKVTGEIEGNIGRAGYIVEIDDLKVYIFLINTWHNNKKAISINEYQLEQALGDHALILMSFGDTEYVTHSVNWDEWARQDDNYEQHPKFDTKEVFCKTDNFRKLDLNKYKLAEYYPKEAE